MSEEKKTIGLTDDQKAEMLRDFHEGLEDMKLVLAFGEKKFGRNHPTMQKVIAICEIIATLTDEDIINIAETVEDPEAPQM